MKKNYYKGLSSLNNINYFYHTQAEHIADFFNDIKKPKVLFKPENVYAVPTTQRKVGTLKGDTHINIRWSAKVNNTNNFQQENISLKIIHSKSTEQTFFTIHKNNWTSNDLEILLVIDTGKNYIFCHIPNSAIQETLRIGSKTQQFLHSGKDNAFYGLYVIKETTFGINIDFTKYFGIEIDIGQALNHFHSEEYDYTKQFFNPTQYIGKLNGQGCKNQKSSVHYFGYDLGINSFVYNNCTRNELARQLKVSPQYLTKTMKMHKVGIYKNVIFAKSIDDIENEVSVLKKFKDWNKYSSSVKSTVFKYLIEARNLLCFNGLEDLIWSTHSQWVTSSNNKYNINNIYIDNILLEVVTYCMSYIQKSKKPKEREALKKLELAKLLLKEVPNDTDFNNCDNFKAKKLGLENLPELYAFYCEYCNQNKKSILPYRDWIDDKHRNSENETFAERNNHCLDSIKNIKNPKNRKAYNCALLTLDWTGSFSDTLSAVNYYRNLGFSLDDILSQIPCSDDGKKDLERCFYK